MKIVEINKLKKSFRQGFFGRRFLALKGLSFSVEKGEVYGLLGPNGAGKTTTIKILTGLLSADSGGIKILGEPIGAPRIREKIGFLPENPQFHDFLTGEEFLNFHSNLLGMPRYGRKEKIKELFNAVGLKGAGDLKLRAYSKGMIQRIGVAQALLGEPEILILDEPMSGLDPIGRKELRDIILGLKEKGKTIFFSTHILPDVEVICDRIGVILNGELKGEGKLEELLGARIKSYEISFRGGNTGLIEKLNNVSTRILRGADQITIYLEKEELVDKTVQDIIQAGGKLAALIPHRETLEEYFVRTYGKEWVR